MDWITPRMRIAVAVLAGTGWIWGITLPKWHDIRINPAVHPMSEWWWLIPVDAAMLILDVWAIVYMTNKDKVDKADKDG